MQSVILLILFIFLSGWKEIAGRDELSNSQTLKRYPVYRIQVPPGWTIQDPPENESIMNTIYPLCTLCCEGIVVTIHNFPTDNDEERIPPGAQINRWKKQFDKLDVAFEQPEAYAGYFGIRLEASGIFKGKPSTMIAWTMQLGSEHIRNLKIPGTSEERSFYKQMRADYTIKAVGPQDLMEQRHAAIIALAHSFELIQEIPHP